MDRNEVEQALEALKQERETRPDRLGQAIDNAITAGLTYRAIGAALGVTHAAAIKAHQRWRERQ